MWQVERRFEPRMERKEAEAKMLRWRDAVSRSRNWTTG
jgi:glycerol kinase